MSPEKVEAAYCRAPLVASCFVHGDPRRSSLVAVVVPDEAALRSWARASGRHTTPADVSVSTLCGDPAAAAAVLAQMGRCADDVGLRGFERAHAVHLSPDAWTVASGLVTPSFKLKRHTARAAFREQLDALYAALPD